MSPLQWGPPCWTFLHTLAATIREDAFSLVVIVDTKQPSHSRTLGKELIHRIQGILRNLPCPECSQHALRFWSQVDTNQIRTKHDLIELLYMFHNVVNYRKRYPLFPHDQLPIYATKQLIPVYNDFIRHFHTHGNLSLIADSFHRKRMLQELRPWIMHYLSYFTTPSRPTELLHSVEPTTDPNEEESSHHNSFHSVVSIQSDPI